jgi:hypothetical protein
MPPSRGWDPHFRLRLTRTYCDATCAPMERSSFRYFFDRPVANGLGAPIPPPNCCFMPFSISAGETSRVCEARFHAWPKGSIRWLMRSPQNMSVGATISLLISGSQVRVLLHPPKYQALSLKLGSSLFSRALTVHTPCAIWR